MNETMQDGAQSKLNVGDKVYCRNKPSEYGEICLISHSRRTCRVILSSSDKVLWYSLDELELDN